MRWMTDFIIAIRLGSPTGIENRKREMEMDSTSSPSARAASRAASKKPMVPTPRQGNDKNDKNYGNDSTVPEYKLPK